MEEVITISANNFDQICRCCLTEISEVEVLVDNVSHLLHVLFSVEVKQDLPQNVCRTCADEISRICNFRKKVFESDQILAVAASLIQKSSPDINLEEHKDLRKNSQISGDETEEFQTETFSDEDNDSEKVDEFCNNMTGNEVLSSVENKEKPTVAQEHVNRKVFNCSCGKVFYNYKIYIEHRKQIKHPKRGLHPCQYCGKEFDMTKMKGHITKHTKEKPFICEKCGSAFTSDSNLRRHMNRHDEEHRFVCEFCSKVFTCRDIFGRHLKFHSNKDPFFCWSCSKGFKDSISYKEHRRITHKKSDGESCVCEVCNKVFSSLSLLKTHLLRHGERNILCNVCGKGFYNKAGLKAHYRKHSGEKPFPCKICEKTFSHYGTLQRHMLIHTGEKPFVCEICSKSFSQNEHLKRHMITHTGEKSFSCSSCDKSYRQQSSLTIHVRTHTGELPYKCDKCGRGFNHSSAMTKHRRTHSKEKCNSANDNKIKDKRDEVQE